MAKLDSEDMVMGGQPAASTAQPDNARWYTITDLSCEFGITPRAIRFYEDQGLLSPERRGQNRIYSRRDRARLAWVLRGKRVGFSLADIREMIDLYDLDDGRRKQREVTLARCKQRLVDLKAQRMDLDEVISELEDFTATMSALLQDKK